MSPPRQASAGAPLWDNYLLAVAGGGLLQFLSALEARLTYPTPPARLFLSRQLEDLAHLAEPLWDDVQFFNNIPLDEIARRTDLFRREMTNAITAKRIASTIRRDGPGRLFVGKDSRMARSLYWSNHPTSYIVLDDGIETIHDSRRRLDELAAGTTRFPGRRGRNLRLFQRFTRQSSEQVPNVSYFTAFEPAIGPGDLVQRHRFRAAAEYLTTASEVDRSSVLVVGTRLVERFGGSFSATNARVMSEITRAQADGFDRVAFVPHPSERDLPWSLGTATLVRTELPIEAHLLRSPSLPARIVAFPSSAVTTLDLVLPESIVIDVVPIEADPAREAAPVDSTDDTIALLRADASRRVNFRLDTNNGPHSA